MRSYHSHEGTKQAQHLTSSMTIPWKPGTQNEVYTGGSTYYYTLLYSITIWPQVQEVQSHGLVIILNSTLG